MAELFVRSGSTTPPPGALIEAVLLTVPVAAPLMVPLSV